MAWMTNLPAGLLEILKRAVAEGAGDFYLTPGEPPLFRGALNLVRTQDEPLAENVVNTYANTVFGDEALSRLGKAEAFIQQAFSVQLDDANGQPVTRRGIIKVSQTSRGYFVSARLFHLHVPEAKAIGVPESVLAAADADNGLLIFSGRTRSGKWTLAYSVLDRLNAMHSAHICIVTRHCDVSLESKLSIVQSKVVGVDVPDMVSGINSGLEQDLDILLVTEAVGVEELDACLEAALSGHLVFIIMSEASPEAAIAQVLDAFPLELQPDARRKMAQVLRCSVAMQLLPKADGTGRVAAYGVLLPDEEMREAIRHANELLKRQTPLPAGCQTIAEHIEQLKSAGMI